MFPIPAIQAIHFLSADMCNPEGSVAEQVTVRAKSLPDASFSQAGNEKHKEASVISWRKQGDSGINFLVCYSEFGE